MRYIVRAMPEREQFLAPIRAELPALEVVWDRSRNAIETWLAALECAGNDAAIHLEDDILPTRGLLAKLDRAIIEHPDHVIQFFSLRRADRQLGSRWMAGSSFLMLQCCHLPPGYSAELLAYYPHWPRRHTEPGGPDVHIKDWLVHRGGERYWLHVPSLVQHLAVRSLIDPRRSSHRQSPTFIPA
jgi:hypothetical protein